MPLQREVRTQCGRTAPNSRSRQFWPLDRAFFFPHLSQAQIANDSLRSSAVASIRLALKANVIPLAEPNGLINAAMLPGPLGCSIGELEVQFGLPGRIRFASHAVGNLRANMQAAMFQNNLNFLKRASLRLIGSLRVYRLCK